MPHNRRQFLSATAASAAVTLLPGCSSRGSEPQMPVAYELGKPLPWVNWAGNQYCFPKHRPVPGTETEVVDALRQAQGQVRAVGAGHSFAALVPTDDTLIATDLLSGLISHDAATLQAELWAGTRLNEVGPLLAGVDQALPNMPDVDHFALGGAIATSVHGTGVRLGSLSSRIVGLTLATPSGELIECSATQHPEVFHAARVSVGALGIITRVRLQNNKSFALTETNRVEHTEDILADLDKRFAQHRHFEFMALPHSDLAATVATDLAQPGDSPKGEDDPNALNDLRRVFDAISWMPGSNLVYERLLKIAMGDSASSVRTGPSYQVFPHLRGVRFREMEYAVPAEAGPACIREILQTIRDQNIPVCFPLEYRRVDADDIWLSMFSGRPAATISVHQYGDLDYKPYFAAIEPIFWKYQGRPHWGKLHTLNATDLAALYPQHWQDFQAVRRQLDPQGKMLNPYLKKMLGA
ncbi:D-arabinono-1,4-lactone oxidase [Rhodoferax sp.]|uniref:D-arabinono-1,4-lactone oxidase n=1 Tax=Rhodoferax sp. TaxID=50421 RepID=UPI00284D6D4C|nr:D-arabinono-1,4-lactone oxidase [Rhodoferax sp.]MDR3367562.1 D-arabinono-1,4-lactone oxidase [Rhodoferax sp.]